MLNKYTILTSLFILINLFSYGEKTEDRTPFIKAVDYCNCKVSLAYAKSFVDKHKDKKIKYKKEIEGYEEINQKTKGCDKNNPIEFSKLSELLKTNSFVKCNDNIASNINKLLKERKNTLKDSSSKYVIEQIVACVYYNSNNSVYKYFLNGHENAIQDIKDELTQDLKIIIDNTQKKEVSNVDISLSKDKEHNQLNQMNTAENKSSFSVQMIVTFIIVLLLIIVVFVLNKLDTSKIDDRLTRHREEIDGLKMQKNQIPSHPITRDNELNKKVKELEHKITELYSKLSLLEDKATKQFSQNTFVNNKESNYQKNDVKKQVEISESVFYLSLPSQEGVFSTVLNKPNNDTFYKLIISSTNPFRAEFEFFNNEYNIKKVVAFPGKILNTTCESLNQLNSQIKNIKTENRGVLIKKNDKWIIEKKAEIRYE